jgi:hypothetical protein
MKGLLPILILCIVLAFGFIFYELQPAYPATVPIENASSTPADLTEIIPGIPSVVYHDPLYDFSISYPSTVLLKTEGFGGYVPLTETPLIAFTLNPDMFRGTNLGEAGVYIGASSTPSIVASCTHASLQAGETTATSSITVHGTTFSVFDSTGAGAGNIYDEKTYRTLVHGACLEIVELLHSSQIGNYPPGKVVAFDRTRFSGILEAMVSTIRFAQ